MNNDLLLRIWYCVECCLPLVLLLFTENLYNIKHYWVILNHSNKLVLIYNISRQERGVLSPHLFSSSGWQFLPFKAPFSSSSGSCFLPLLLICVSGQLLCWKEEFWFQRGGEVSTRKSKSERTLIKQSQDLFVYQLGLNHISGAFWTARYRAKKWALFFENQGEIVKY